MPLGLKPSPDTSQNQVGSLLASGVCPLVPSQRFERQKKKAKQEEATKKKNVTKLLEPTWPTHWQDQMQEKTSKRGEGWNSNKQTNSPGGFPAGPSRRTHNGGHHQTQLAKGLEAALGMGLGTTVCWPHPGPIIQCSCNKNLFWLRGKGP